MSLSKELSYRFRGIRALYGDDVLEKFINSHVCIVGSGGVGSWIIEALVRSGIGNITIIDNDVVDESNTNRQLHTLVGNYKKYKAQVMKDRMKLINPDVRIDVVLDFLTADNMNVLLPKNIDAIVDAIDSLQSKAALIDYAIKNKLFIVSSGGAGGKTNPQSVKVADLSNATNDKLLSRLRTILRKNYSFPKAGTKMKVMVVYCEQQGLLSKEITNAVDVPNFGANMCVTATVGLNIASLVIENFRKNVNG